VLHFRDGALQLLGALAHVGPHQCAQILVAHVLAGEHRVACARVQFVDDVAAKAVRGAVGDVWHARAMLETDQRLVERLVGPRLVGLRRGTLQ
jgi:hypothetical protein